MRFVHDFEPGISRAGEPGRFLYSNADGSQIDDRRTLARIRALVIPPGWSAVWISPDPDAHLQATGIDSRGRKQYRYHPAWRHDRDEVKFHDMESFGRVQPALRSGIDRDLASAPSLTHRTVLALALRLLDVGLFRVGSDRYARDNQHYGLTTLLLSQVTVRNREALFDYVGKAGKRQRLAVHDPEAVAVVGSLRHRRSGPPELLAFRGARGWARVHRDDVNNFLRVEAGGPFSAKEYRTWNATVIAAATLASHRPSRTRAAAVAARTVADALGNTPAVARRSYIDPRVLDGYADGDVIDMDDLAVDPWGARALVEARVLDLLARSREP